ncbi:MAG: RsmD family RNA methyltransferase [Candidatus Thorarchaeota archaeon]
MRAFFAIISGNDVNLAKAEVDSLIGLTGADARVSWFGQLAQIESTHDVAHFLLERAAMTKEAGSIIGHGPISDTSMEWLSDDVLMTCVKPTDTFSVRTKSLTAERHVEQRERLSALLGARIKNLTNARVSLDEPDVKVLAIIIPDRILVCISKESRLRLELRLREPGRKPFFHPSMMNSQLARVMCNLAGVKPKAVVLDPFCGGGGILGEAASIGARVVGLELDWRLIIGALKNLAGSLERETSLVQADSRLLPLQIGRFDCIATDPPYGRASSTRGAKAKRLVLTLLENAPEIVRDGGRLCICGSHDMGIRGMIQDLGFIIKYHIPVPVHSGLTREITVVEF